MIYTRIFTYEIPFSC